MKSCPNVLEKGKKATCIKNKLLSIADIDHAEADIFLDLFLVVIIKNKLGKFGQMSEMQTSMASFEYNWKTPNESAKSSQWEPEQVAKNFLWSTSLDFT